MSRENWDVLQNYTIALPPENILNKFKATFDDVFIKYEKLALEYKTLREL